MGMKNANLQQRNLRSYWDEFCEIVLMEFTKLKEWNLQGFGCGVRVNYWNILRRNVKMFWNYYGKTRKHSRKCSIRCFVDIEENVTRKVEIVYRIIFEEILKVKENFEAFWKNFEYVLLANTRQNFVKITNKF